MKCISCGSEWNQRLNNNIVNCCPFCGCELNKESCQSKELDLSMVISQIINQFGVDVVLQKDRFISIIGDIAPMLKKEKKILSVALDEDIAQLFFKCSVEDRNSHIIIAKRRLDGFLSESAIEMVVSSFAVAFGWDYDVDSEFYNQSNTGSKTQEIDHILKNDKVDIQLESDYKSAIHFLETKEYDKAIKLFQLLKNHKDSLIRLSECYNLLNQQYEVAKTIMNLAVTEDDYNNASQEFEAISFYNDSEECIKQCRSSIKNLQEKELLVIKEIVFGNIGDIVHFGNHEWYIINKHESYCTLLSRKTFTKSVFFPMNKNVTWKTCAIRTWLNDDFYNTSFKDEKKCISKTTLDKKNAKNLESENGFFTEDYVFLLSIEEVESLDYSIRNCGDEWWLRSSVRPYGSYGIATVLKDGTVNYNGRSVDFNCGIRPAINIKVRSFDSEILDAYRTDTEKIIARRKQLYRVEEIRYKREQEWLDKRQQLIDKEEELRSSIQALTNLISYNCSNLEKQQSIYNTNAGTFFGKRKAQEAREEIVYYEKKIAEVKMEKRKLEKELIDVQTELSKFQTN